MNGMAVYVILSKSCFEIVKKKKVALKKSGLYS